VDAWYEAGLRFACSRCGQCCTGPGGTVRVSAEEEARLAARLGLDRATFRARWIRPLPDGAASLRERPNGDCVFLDGAGGCAVYGDRPRQCRTWPFWRRNLASPEHWRGAGAHCPGIGRGELHGGAEIRALSAEDGTSGVIPPSGASPEPGF
jgi:uncharacterized protein